MTGKEKRDIATKSKYKDVWEALRSSLLNKSPQTQRAYISTFNGWCQFLKIEQNTNTGAKKLLAASRKDVLRYVESLSGRRQGPEAATATIRKNLSALRKYYRFLIEEYVLLDVNPFDDLGLELEDPRKRRIEIQENESLGLDDIKNLFLLPPRSTIKGFRDRAIFALICGAALKRQEIANLQVRDIRFDDHLCFVHLRNEKRELLRKKYVLPWAVPFLKEYLRRRKELKGVRIKSLFFRFLGRGGSNVQNEAISAAGLYKTFMVYSRRGGYENWATPDRFRMAVQEHVEHFNSLISSDTLKAAELHDALKESFLGSLMEDTPSDQNKKLEQKRIEIIQPRNSGLVSKGDVKKLILKPDRSTLKGLRDATIFALTSAAALKKSELKRLMLRDIEFKGVDLCCISLRNRQSALTERRYALPWIIPILKSYLRMRSNVQGLETEYVFHRFLGRGGSNPQNKPLSGPGISRVFLLQVQQGGLNPNLTPVQVRLGSVKYVRYYNQLLEMGTHQGRRIDPFLKKNWLT